MFDRQSKLSLNLYDGHWIPVVDPKIRIQKVIGNISIFEDESLLLLLLKAKDEMYGFIQLRVRRGSWTKVLNLGFWSSFVSKILEAQSRIGRDLGQDKSISDIHLGFTSRVLKFILELTRNIWYFKLKLHTTKCIKTN